MKIFLYFLLLTILFYGCQSQQKEKPSLSIEQEVQILKDSLKSKQSQLAFQERFIIKQGKVGEIKLGDWINQIRIQYPMELMKSEQIRSTDDGNIFEPIYILTESGKELFKITCNFNYTNRDWEDKVGEINIINPNLKTENNVSVNSSIGEFLDAYQEVKFFYTYVTDRFWCTTAELENTQFELDSKAFVGEMKDVYRELAEIESKYFNKNGKIIRIRLY